MANNFQMIGEAFTNHYYKTFDTNRRDLVSLYRDQSMLTFEGNAILGANDIVKKLVELPFQKVAHNIVTCDCQPVTVLDPQGILVAVSGNLIVDDNQHPLKFAQSFHLVPDPTNTNNYWVLNDIFRLNYG